MIQNLQAGTYDNITPTGTVNGVNTVFTLPAAPSPASSLEFRVNGQTVKAGGTDYTLSGVTVTMTWAPPTGSILTASFLVDS